MPVAIALIFSVVLLAIMLVGVIWSLLLLAPFYAFVGVAVFLIWRDRKKDAELAAAVEQDAEKQRLFNEQETRAWQTSLQKQRRNAVNRERMLRHFDGTRDPPKP